VARTTLKRRARYICIIATPQTEGKGIDNQRGVLIKVHPFSEKDDDEEEEDDDEDEDDGANWDDLDGACCPL
jgi:hypothetical protein